MSTPSKKANDPDFMVAMYGLPTRCACTCHPPAASPFQLAPFGAEHHGLSEEAYQLRGEVIAKLLPQLKALTTDLNLFNQRGGIGPGEVCLLGDLQHWLLQLLVEQDALRLAKAGVDAPKAP